MSTKHLHRKLFLAIIIAAILLFSVHVYSMNSSELPFGLFLHQTDSIVVSVVKVLFICLGICIVLAGIAFLWVVQLKKVVNKKTSELQKEIEHHTETEKTLLEERELLQNLMDNIPDTIYFKDTESRFIKINQAQAELLGLNSPDDAIMKSDFDFFSPEHAKEAFEDERKIIRTGNALISKNEKVKDGTGNFRWVSATKVPMIDASGNIFGIVGISRDVSVRKKFEEELKESEERYRSLFENLLSAFIYFEVVENENGEPINLIYREANQVFLKIVSKTREEIIDNEVTVVNVFPKLDLLEYYKKTISLQQAINQEYFCDCLNRWVYFSFYSDRKGFLAVQFEDIHDRKTAEEQISKSEQKFRTLFDTSSDVIFILDEDKIIDCNRKTYETFLCTRDKIVSRKVNDISPTYQLNGDTSINLIHQKLDEIKKGHSYNFEWLFLRFDGNLFFADVSITKINIDGSEFIQAVIRDITEWKTTENILKQREIQLKSLAENLPDILIRFDPMLQVTFINNQIETILGVSAGEILGQNLSSLPLKDEIKERWGNAIKDVFRKGVVQKIEITIPFSNGVKHFESRLVPEFSANEIVKTVQSINRDITEQRRTEKIQNAIFQISEAVNTAEKAQTLYKSIHDTISELMPAKNFYIALYDENDKILNFPYFVDEFDTVPEGRPIGKGLTEYVLRTGKAVLASEELDYKLRLSGEVELVGEPAKIWLGVPLKLGEKTSGVMVVQDYKNENAYGPEEEKILLYVSEQVAHAINKKNSEYRLIQYAEELKESNAVKDKFFSIISHDLRSPFHALLGVSEILSDEASALSLEEIRHLNNEMYKTLKNQFKLLENLLEWSRIQTGKMSYQPGKLDLSFKVNEVINLLTGNALKKGINILNEIDHSVFVSADENMLRTILHNLISNAIKFTNQRGQVKIAATKINGSIEIIVSDNGVGMSADEIDKLFKLGVQFTKPGTSKEKGTGLGLMLCKELVEKHKGKIWVESKVGYGSNFIFTLPVATK